MVSTRVGGMPTVVLDGETGALVDTEDEAGFAAAVRRVLQDDDFASRLSREGSERVRRMFSFDRLLDDVEVLYRRLLAAGGGVREVGHGGLKHRSQPSRRSLTHLGPRR